MRDPIGTVPAAYAVHRVGSTWMVLDREQAPSLIDLRLADASVRESLFARAPRRGRGSAPSLDLDRKTAMILRRYQHGGALAMLTGSLFWGPERPLQELRVTARAEMSGAPVPHVLCLVLWPVFGPFWSAMIGTREERPAAELLSAIRDAPGKSAGVPLARKVGAAIRKLHDAGVEHGDLQLRNILVAENGESRIVVVDLDRAIFHRYGLVPASCRARNLGRLARSTVKCGLWGKEVGRREVAAFADTYTRGNRNLRSDLRAWIPRERLKLLLHRLTYLFRS